MEKSAIILMLCAAVFAITEAKKVHYIHWNKDSPLFRIDNTDHIIDVKEYDQANLICPVAKPGTIHPEKHVIYSVTKEEYDSCRITNPKPRIVAICNRPHRLMYFTITFRSFTPTPGGLEFHPGQDYYFISTSSRDDLHRRVGGGCATHNMRMIFKVHDNPTRSQQQLEASSLMQQQQQQSYNDIDSPRINTIDSEDLSVESLPAYTHVDQPSALPSVEINVVEEEREVVRSSSSSKDGFYFYHPKDLVAMEQALSEFGSGGALPYTSDLRVNIEASTLSPSSSPVSSTSSALLIVLVSSLVLRLSAAL